MRKLAVGFVIATVAFGVACTEAPVSPEQLDVSPSLGVSSTGNGAPGGTHYSLNIIGVERKGNLANSRSNGRRIFVPLGAKCNIGLQQGSSFDVIDYLCDFDGNRAEFQLPNPVGTDGRFAYSVYARALGKPGGSARMAACYKDAATLEEWCNTSVVTLTRSGGKSTFSDVSRQLLQVCADVDPTSTTTLKYVGLFDAVGSDYWWEYDNTGLRLAQLRFYPIPTDSYIGTACDGGRTSPTP